MMKQIITLFILMLFTACSSQPVQKESTEKSYSDSTEREFNRLERGLPDLPTSPTVTPIKNKFNIETHRDGDKDRLNELNQNLNIYCMKSSRRKKFRTEKSCQDFVQKSLHACEKNHRIVNRSLINCVKNKLQIK